jgi:hypothetical protein
MKRGWRRVGADMILILFCCGAIGALFAGVVMDVGPDISVPQLALIALGLSVVPIAGIWLDRREARRDRLESEAAPDAAARSSFYAIGREGGADD